MSRDEMVWREALPWSRDIKQWADVSMYDFMQLDESNFFNTKSDTELIMRALYDAAGSYSSAFDFRPSKFEATVGEYAFVIARCPDGFVGSSHYGLYRELADEMVDAPLEETRKFCEPYSALAWRIADARNHFTYRYTDVINVDHLLRLSKEFDGSILDFDEHMKFVEKTRSGRTFNFQAIKNDIDHHIMDALAGEDVY